MIASQCHLNPTPRVPLNLSSPSPRPHQWTTNGISTQGPHRESGQRPPVRAWGLAEPSCRVKQLSSMGLGSGGATLSPQSTWWSPCTQTLS